MQLYPAIDIKNGQCVRLRQGVFHDAKVYSNVPANIASQWEKSGASYIHLVDLDGALEGHSVNEAVIREIIKTIHIPAELGGGMRTMNDIETALSYGVTRVILGTKAVEDAAFIKEVVDEFGADKIVIGVDAKDGMVAMKGWETVSTVRAAQLCHQMKDMGITTIIYTDISKDGMMMGPNILQTKLLAQESGLEVIASGGVSCMDDLQKLSEAGVQGVVVGKALYENKINLKEAVLRFEKQEQR